MKEKYYLVAKTITRWKLDNSFENWLGYKADRSEFWKKLYVLYYQLFDHQYYSKGKKFIDDEIAKQRPNLQKKADGTPLSDEYLRRDMIYSLHRYGVNFIEYFVYEFYKKNYIGRSLINNLRIQYGYCEQVNDPNVRELFDNKVETYKHFKPFYKRDVVAVITPDNQNEFQDFLKKHKSFIFKPLRGVCGRGIKIYRDFNEDPVSFLSKALSNGPFIVEEIIEQSPEMSVLHQESINTVRVATFKIGNEITIYGAALRMGVGKSIVDNAGSGGIFCHINHSYGFVDSYGKDYLGNKYIYHPDTKIELLGFNIPEWDELQTQVKKAAQVLDGATVISWDWAYSKSGWVMLEANDVGEPLLIQNHEQGNKNVLHELLDKYFEYKNQSKK